MRNLRIACTLIGLAMGSVWAQEPPAAKGTDDPAKTPRVASIRLGLGSGMCYGYCWIELEVKPGEAILLEHSRNEDKRRCPDLKVRADLSDKHWKELVQLIDRQALFALPESVGCPGCVDEVVESIEVRFTNRTKKSLYYNRGDPPQEIKALSARLAALQEKLGNELPPTNSCGQ